MSEIETIELHVSCIPHGRPRARARVAKSKSGKHFARIYHPKGGKGSAGKSWHKSHAFEQAMVAATYGKMPLTPWEGPVRVDWDAYFERPQRLLKKSSPECEVWHTVRPDKDNIEKAILDALKKAGLYRDDSQVVTGIPKKMYVAKGYAPGVIIRARRLSETEGLF